MRAGASVRARVDAEVDATALALGAGAALGAEVSLDVGCALGSSAAARLWSCTARGGDASAPTEFGLGWRLAIAAAPLCPSPVSRR